MVSFLALGDHQPGSEHASSARARQKGATHNCMQFIKSFPKQYPNKNCRNSYLNKNIALNTYITSIHNYCKNSRKHLALKKQSRPLNSKSCFTDPADSPLHQLDPQHLIKNVILSISLNTFPLYSLLFILSCVFIYRPVFCEHRVQTDYLSVYINDSPSDLRRAESSNY